jgi:uncharacterized membrane protein
VGAAIALAIASSAAFLLLFSALEAPESINAALPNHLGGKILLVCLACAMAVRKAIRQKEASVIHTV